MKPKALRYNEPWRDLTGDNLVSAMASRIEELTEQVAKHKEIQIRRARALKALKGEIK